MPANGNPGVEMYERQLDPYYERCLQSNWGIHFKGMFRRPPSKLKEMTLIHSSNGMPDFQQQQVVLNAEKFPF